MTYKKCSGRLTSRELPANFSVLVVLQVVGGVAQWLGRRCLAGGLSLIYG